MSDQSGIRTLVGGRYPKANAETHRRRATHLEPPFVSLFATIRRPSNWPETYKPFLHSIFDAINRHEEGTDDYKTSAETAGRIIESAIDAFDTNRDSQDKSGDRKPRQLTATIPDPSVEGSKWRVEVHRDFVAITLFMGLAIEGYGDLLKVYPVGLVDKNFHFEAKIEYYNHVYDASFCKGLNTFLFDTLMKLSEAMFDPIVRNISGKFNKDALGMDVVSALIYGVSVPWTLIDKLEVVHSDNSSDGIIFPHRVRPEFPIFDEPRIRPDRMFDARVSTNRYLTRIWSGLEGDGLLLGSVTSDAVACYMLGGHFIYVSSLGIARPDQESDVTEPLKYLIMYDDKDNNAEKSGIARRKQSRHIVPSGSAKDLDRGYNFSWRLSRFVNRLHDVGSARLIAMAQYQYISPFVQKLKDAENRLSRPGFNWSLITLKEIEDDLHRAAFVGGVTIDHRAGIVSHYKSLAESLMSDFDIVSLPTFQPYDQFIRRRVFGTTERSLAVSARFSSILKRINSGRSSSQSDEILKIQRAADLVGTLIFIYYGSQLSYYMAKFIAHEFKGPIPTLISPELAGILGAGISLLIIGPLTRHTLNDTLGKTFVFYRDTIVSIARRAKEKIIRGA